MRLLTSSHGNTKLRKSERESVRIVSLALSPADIAGGTTNCTHSTESCRAACVGGPNVGLAMVWAAIMAGRIAKTKLLHADREGFIRQLVDELRHEERLAGMHRERLVCRLNTFSDIPWETDQYGSVPQQFPNVVFYDYTKRHHRRNDTPGNYTLVHSWDETTKGRNGCIDALEAGRNVAVVFAQRGDYAGNAALRQRIPAYWWYDGRKYSCFDGDVSDLRCFDPVAGRRGVGRICAIRLKAGTTEGRNKAIASGFCEVIP